MSRTRAKRWGGRSGLRAPCLGCWLLAFPGSSCGSESPPGEARSQKREPEVYDLSVTNARQVLDSAEFRRLVAGRWRVSLALTALLFVLYYGYIILIATNRQLLSRPVSGSTTIGIPLGAGGDRRRLGADGDLRRLGEPPATIRPSPNSGARRATESGT